MKQSDIVREVLKHLRKYENDYYKYADYIIKTINGSIDDLDIMFIYTDDGKHTAIDTEARLKRYTEDAPRGFKLDKVIVVDTIDRWKLLVFLTK